MTRTELTQKVLFLFQEERSAQERSPLADLIDQAIVEVQQGNLNAKACEALEELQKWHWSIYADTSSAEHLIAGGMYQQDAQRHAEMAQRHGDRSSEIIELLNAVDQLPHESVDS